MKVLIFGGAGFIGANIARKILEEGGEVLISDDLSRTGSRLNLEWLREKGRVRFFQTDIRHYSGVKEIIHLHRDVDIIFHFAAQVAVTLSVDNPRKDFEINALGTFNILEAVREEGINPPFIFSSTNKVYGGMEKVKVEEKEKRYVLPDYPEGIGEDFPLDFHSPYGCSKGCADQYVRDYARIYGMNTVVLRQSCIYGPRQFGIEDQGWVAHFFISTLLDKPLFIYGNGKQVRDLLYIDDLVELCWKCKDNIEKVKGEIFNVGGGKYNTISLLELLETMERKGMKPRVSFSDPRPGDQKVFICDIRKAKNQLGWKPRVNVEEGIERLLRWIKDNLDIIRSAFT
ncbi:SDR family NAD(P)-dependent oxidoreductase [Candidatus Calescamantes bacterium]|nr:SDR family NAD(P)-dependent oxidoreductase [Candidatus Calescamantes bacterium]